MWVKRCPVGESLRWSSTACDVRGARLIMRRLTLDLDVARNSPAFKHEVAAKLQEGRYSTEDGYAGAPADSTGATVKANACVVIEVWDRKWDERHYIAEGLDEFLEKDSRNPYVDAKGRYSVRYGVPFVYYCPAKSRKDGPYKPYGLPLGAFGWPLQRLMIKLASHNLDAVKKVTVRAVELLGELIEDEEDAITSGITGTVVHRPPELNTEQLKNVPLVRPIDFGRVDPAVFEQILWAEQMMSKVMAWPLSQMTGAPQSDTATGEEIAVTAGSSQMGDVIRELETAVAWGQEIKRHLVWNHYSSEDIAELVGQKSRDEFIKWRAEAPSSRGDRISVRLSASVQGEDPVRRQQVERVLLYAQAQVDPATGLPKYRTDKIEDEWVRLHGLGKLVPYEPTPEELQALEQGGPGGGKFTPAGGEDSGPGRSAPGGGRGRGSRDSSAKPTRAAQFSAVRRA